MTMSRTLVLAALLLSGCASPEPLSPEQSACAAEANRDPAVHDLLIKGAGSEEFRQNHTDQLRLTRQRAMLGCLRSRGLILPGGVEPQRPL